jgi:hypothetical protein
MDPAETGAMTAARAKTVTGAGRKGPAATAANGDNAAGQAPEAGSLPPAANGANRVNAANHHPLCPKSTSVSFRMKRVWNRWPDKSG